MGVLLHSYPALRIGENALPFKEGKIRVRGRKDTLNLTVIVNKHLVLPNIKFTFFIVVW